MTGYKAEVVADSISPDGVRITSMLCVYPRFIHAEVLRHRVFSSSVASSRAIPTEKLVEQVREDPFIPETFNERVKGMGVGEPLDDQENCRVLWKESAINSAWYAENLMRKGLDKSRANRLLEPYLYVTHLITSTEWSNFFALRDHPDAQPEFLKIARMMRRVMQGSQPLPLHYGEWHMPLLSSDEYHEALCECNATHYWDEWKYISAGRCARVSYDKQGESEDHDRSIFRAQSLIESGHMSPFEHIATPIDPTSGHDHGKWILHGFNPDGVLDDEIEVVDGVNRLAANTFVGNFRGWVQMRAEIPNQHDFSKILAERRTAR